MAKRAGSGTARGKRAPLRVNLAQLQRALRGRPEVMEALEASAEKAGTLKASGRPGVNVAQMWRLTMAAMYASADVPVLAVRECAQNSRDAAAAAVKARQIHSGEGRFEVEWDQKARRLVLSDNGIGMSAEDILERFLVLGASGKAAALDSNEAAGGFGVAKAVILGAASRFRWSVHTRDNLAVSKGMDGDVEIFATTFRQGTRIELEDISNDYDLWWDAAGGGPQPLEDRLRELLSANDLPDMTLIYNGEEIRPRFSRRGGSKIEVLGSWGEGTAATVKAYKRPDRRGAYWVRLNGLQQFKASSRGDLGVDVVVDLTTTVRPGELGYPLNAGRDSLQGAARHAFQALIAEVERENLSAGKNEEDEVFEPDEELDDELAGDVADLTRSLLDDPELAGVLEAAGVTAGGARQDGVSGLDSRSGLDDNTRPGEPASGDAGVIDGIAPTPDGFGQPDHYHRRSADDAEPAAPRTVLRTNLPDDYVLDLGQSGGDLPWFPAGLRTTRAIRAALERAEAESPFELSSEVIAALMTAEDDRELTVAQLRTIAEAMNTAAQLVAVTRGLDSPRVEASTRKSQKRNGNPFGNLGALRISRTSFDKARARAFKRNPRKWLPALLLWSTTLKLMAQAGGIQRALRPGFILDDSTIGLAQRLRDSSVVTIYLHPYRLADVVTANRDRPISVAGFLHGVAAHELTHADGRMGDGHSQSFVSAREDLGQRTVHLLPQLAALAVKLLKLPEPVDENAVRAARLEKHLEAAKAARDQLRRELRAESRKGERCATQYDNMLGQIEAAEERIRTLEGQLEACFAAVHAIGEETSREARAACEATVGRHGGAGEVGASGVPAVIQVPAASASEPDEPDEPASARAVYLLAAVRGVLESTPPAGLDPDYAARFFRRHHRHLARIIEVQLAAHRSAGSQLGGAR